MDETRGLALAILVGTVGCGSDEAFTLEGFSNTVPIQTAATATLGLDGHDVIGVTVVGDIDGDGAADAIITTSGFDATTGSYAELHVLYGGSVSGDIDVGSLPTLVGDSDSPRFTGDAAVAIGDIDGDGLADFVVSKTSGTACDGYKDTSPRDGQHKGVYVIYGSSARLTGAVPLAQVGVTLQDPTLCTGSLLIGSRLGDLDGDGIDDFALVDPERYASDPGQIWVLYGSHTKLAGTVDLSSVAAVIQQAGPDKPDRIAALGDVDGDGRGDFIVSTSEFLGTSFGARIVYGASTRFTGTVALDGPRNTLLGGFDPSTAYVAVSGLGDLDGDGPADLAVFELPFQVIDQTLGAGTHHVFYGRTGGFGGLLDLASSDATIRAAAGGVSTLTSGDVDGDGMLDVVMSDPGVNASAGAVYVAPGTGRRFGGAVDLGSNGTAYLGHQVRVQCIDEGDDNCSGGQMVGAEVVVGDLTGDGKLDVIATAPTAAGLGQGLGAKAFVLSPANP